MSPGKTKTKPVARSILPGRGQSAGPRSRAGPARGRPSCAILERFPLRKWAAAYFFLFFEGVRGAFSPAILDNTTTSLRKIFINS